MVVLCEIYFVVVLFLTTFFLLKHGKTALHIAAEKGFEQIMKILVEHGSNVNLQDAVFIFFFFLIFIFISLFFLILFVVVVHHWLFHVVMNGWVV